MMQKGENLIERFEHSASKRSYVVVFSAVFLVFFISMCFSFLMVGKGFLWLTDGLEQQYVFFAAQGEWLRQILNTIFVEHSLALPMWSTEIGYGGDMLVTLFSCIGDPVNLISVFFPLEYADLALNMTVAIHLYLAGLIFSFYCLSKGNGRFGTLIGATVFMFSGFTLLAFTQVFMLACLVYGPLVLWGVDKVFDRKNPTLFIVSIALCFLNSVTFSYSICLLLLVYCLVRYWYLDEKKTPRGFAKWVFKIAGYTMIGALIGMVFFIPNAMAILGQGRLGVDRPEALFYEPLYYIKLLAGFLAGTDVGADCSYGFAAIALIAVFVLFGTKKSRDVSGSADGIMKIMFIVLTVFLCLPVIGKVFNGFAYPNNRWVWAYVLCVSYIVVAVMPRLLALNVRQKRFVVIGSIAYALATGLIFLPFASKEVLFSCVVLIGLAFLLCNAKSIAKQKAKLAILGSTFVCIAFVFNNFGSIFASDGPHAASRQVGIGRSYELLVNNNPNNVVSKIVDDSFWRYDGSRVPMFRNSNMVQHQNALLFYSSYYNDLVDRYHSYMGLISSSMNFSYTGLDARTPLEALAGVKYFVVPEGQTDMLPPLFTHKAACGVYDGTEYIAYGTDDYLPTTFFYDEVIDEADFEAMTPAQRQQALLQGVVIEEPSSLAKNADLRFTDQAVSYEITPKLDKEQSFDDVNDAFEEQGIEIDGTKFTVVRSGATIVLKADIPADVEAYLYIKGVKYSDVPPSSRFTEAQRESMSLYSKELALFDDVFYGSPTKDVKFDIKLDGVNQQVWNPTASSHLYGGKDSWLVNLGYSDEERKDVEVTFSSAGVYDLEDLQIVVQPIDAYADQIQKLKSTSAKIHGASFNGSTYSCTADAEGSPKLLYFGIPYSSGWSAYVDGNPVEIKHSNVAFMGVELDGGRHEVELRYETPGLKTGAMLSLVGLVMLGTVVVVGRVRRTKIAEETK